MRALVTGAGGFAGRYLVKELKKQNFEVVGLGCENSSQFDYPYIQIDIREISRQHIQETRPDVIFHLAAISVTSKSIGYHEYFDVNFNGTNRLYEAVIESGLRPRIIYIGSGDAYGLVEEKDNPLKEEQPLRPVTQYQVSKASADILSQMYARHGLLDIVILRPFNHTGVGQSTDFVCPAFAQQIAFAEKGKTEVIKTGSLEPVRDFLDVRDVVRAYIIAYKKARSGSVYNISSKRGISIREILDILLSYAKIPLKVEQEESKIRKDEIAIKIGDNSRFVEDTGWMPQYDIRDTLKEMLDYFRVST